MDNLLFLSCHFTMEQDVGKLIAIIGDEVCISFIWGVFWGLQWRGSLGENYQP